MGRIRPARLPDGFEHWAAADLRILRDQRDSFRKGGGGNQPVRVVEEGRLGCFFPNFAGQTIFAAIASPAYFALPSLPAPCQLAACAYRSAGL